MGRVVPRLFFLMLASLAVSVSSAMAAAPVLEGLPTNGQPAHVPPIVPVGKALILPVTAYDEDGDPVRLSVTSSNAKVMVRVKTGNPLLKFRIQHDGDGTDQDPAYSGDLVFQLFRDLTPETAGYIAGFAQGGFYDGVTFHRLADLYGGSASAPKSFIFQGGDPLGTGTGGPGFKFDNEFVAPLIFAGRGQLAMANAGYDRPSESNPGATFGGTNGSQFFITDGSLGFDLNGNRVDGRPRFLDFGHTIFGQLTHGWELLDKLRATPRDSSDRPLNSVRIVSATVVPSYHDGTRLHTDAVLVVTAKGPGTATITVRADDGKKKGVTVKRFKVTAEKDPINSPPFLSRLGNHTVNQETRIDLPFEVYDLEFDHVTFAQELMDNGIQPNFKGLSDLTASRVISAKGSPGFTGALKLVLAVTQYDMSGGQRYFDDFAGTNIAVGEPQITATGEIIQGAAAALLSQVSVAQFKRASSSGVAATINWGDGTETSGGTISGAGTEFQVAGAHTYNRPGVYPLTVTLTSAGGLLKIVKGTAIITSGSLRAAGASLTAKGRTVNGGVATFQTDDIAADAASYKAVVDWGDGALSNGKVNAVELGSFVVTGKHAYRDAQVYSASVRITRVGDALDTAAVAWSIITPQFNSKPYLPPFAQSHLVAKLDYLPVDPQNIAAGAKQVRSTVTLANGTQQTYLTLLGTVLNSGNKKSAKGKLQFFLSRDPYLNKKAITNAGGISTPADLPVKIGKRSSITVPALKPGYEVQCAFDKTEVADLRLTLPPSENGTGYYLIGVLTYADPIAKHMPIEREFVAGPL